MDPHQPKIYILEDNEIFQTLITTQLKPISNDLHVFSNGKDFLKQMSILPDLVILDYQLEGKMNGYDVLKELKKLPFPPPAIFFSTNLELSITSSILHLGVVEYIEKTVFAMPRLKKCIIQTLKKTAGEHHA